MKATVRQRCLFALGLGLVVGFLLCLTAPKAVAGEKPATQVDLYSDPLPKGAGAKPRLDLFGDPLPEGIFVRLGTVGLRHAGASTIAFSIDGRKFISFGRYRVIRTWEPTTGRLREEKPLPNTI